MISKLKIISGGQSGVDRAALDFALKHTIKCGGWCPKGRIAEDGKIDGKYPLKETLDSTYKTRTKFNVQESDGTLIFFNIKMDDGTRLTFDVAQKMNKPVLRIDLRKEKDINLQKTRNWINFNYLEIVNVAGPRESNTTGIYSMTLEFLEGLLET